MIQITTAEEFITTIEKDRETGESITTTERDRETSENITVIGASRHRYWLTDQSTITAISHDNGLNKLCRKLVKLDLSRPAEVRGTDSVLRYTISSIEKLAQWDLWDGKGWERHRPFRGIARAA